MEWIVESVLCCVVHLLPVIISGSIVRTCGWKCAHHMQVAALDGHWCCKLHFACYEVCPVLGGGLCASHKLSQVGSSCSKVGNHATDDPECCVLQPTGRVQVLLCMAVYAYSCFALHPALPQEM
jgi:hypothetical protein